MKDLKYQAIVLIYPDGVIENVLIMKGMENHIDYYRWLLEHSQKFANIVYHFPNKIDFRDWLTLEKALVEAGLVVIKNLEISYLADDMSFINSRDPFEYVIYLPSNIKKSKAKISMNKILQENQREEFRFGLYFEETKTIEEIEYHFIEKGLDSKEEEIKR